MRILFFFPLFAAALLAGCATAPADRAVDKIDIARFHAVNVAPVQFSTAAAKEIPADERSSVESEFRAALKDGMAPAPLADGPSVGVVRVEVTVTELNSSSPAVNLLSTALLFVPFDAGGVAFEARFYDGEGTEPFARTTHRHMSTPVELKGSFRRYGHATKALHDWAEEIRGIGP